jgi:predicted NBD/HSP70 family sugar kinase
MVEGGMRSYVGLDVSQATTAICVVDEDGRTLAEGKVPTCPRAIAAFVRTHPAGELIQGYRLQDGSLTGVPAADTTAKSRGSHRWVGAGTFRCEADQRWHVFARISASAM